MTVTFGGALRVGESCNGGGEGYGLDANNIIIVTNFATGEVTMELYLTCSKTHLGRWVDMADVISAPAPVRRRLPHSLPSQRPHRYSATQRRRLPRGAARLLGGEAFSSDTHAGPYAEACLLAQRVRCPCRLLNPTITKKVGTRCSSTFGTGSTQRRAWKLTPTFS